MAERSTADSAALYHTERTIHKFTALNHQFQMRRIDSPHVPCTHLHVLLAEPVFLPYGLQAFPLLPKPAKNWVGGNTRVTASVKKHGAVLPCVVLRRGALRCIAVLYISLLYITLRCPA